MSDQYSRRLSSVLSSSGVPSGSAAQDGFTERRIPVMAADGIVIHRIERVHESAGDGVDGYGYVEGPKARNKIRMQDEGASNAQDGDSSSEEELLEFPETTPEEMISLALAQPNHWALREKPTLQMRSHSNGTCTPCMFFLLCNRCHFGRSCGCCHAVNWGSSKQGNAEEIQVHKSGRCKIRIVSAAPAEAGGREWTRDQLQWHLDDRQLKSRKSRRVQGFDVPGAHACTGGPAKTYDSNRCRGSRNGRRQRGPTSVSTWR